METWEKLIGLTNVKSFVDCVYENPTKLNDFKTKLNMYYMRIITQCSNVMIYNDGIFYLIKNRNPEVDNNGKIDVNKTHEKIKQLDFTLVPSKELTIVLNTFNYDSNIIIKLK